jgi:nucleotide-binding universal stress UspA family protein
MIKFILMHRTRILVSVSFGPQADAALKYARKIAGVTRDTISCLYVVEEPGYITGKFISKEVRQKIRREAEQKLSARVNAIYSREDTIDFEIIVTSGKVYRKILEKASDLHARMIIMGRSDIPDLRKDVIGSNTIQTVARATLPVITLRSSKYIADEHILLPLDLTKHTGLKVSKAIEMAKLLGSKVTLFAMIASGQQGREPEFRNRLHEIKQLFTESGIRCNQQLTFSHEKPAAGILTYAGKIRAGLILIMTQQETHATEMFIGSTARELIKHAEVPVVSINPQTEPSV